MRRVVISAVLAVLTIPGLALAQQPLPQVPISRAAAVDRALHMSPELQARLSVEEQARLGLVVPRLFNPQARLEVEGDRAGFGGDYVRKFSVEQELDLRGERGARRSVASANLALARAERAARTQEIRLAVEREVGRWLTFRRRISLLDSLSTHAESLLTAARVAVRRETLQPFTERQLALDVAQLEGDRQNIAGSLAAEEARLRTLLLWPPGQELSFIDDLDRAEWRCEPDSLVAQAFRSRADMARASSEESLRVAELNFERRTGGVNPTLGVSLAREKSSFDGADFTGRSEVTSGLTGLSKAETRLGLSLALPLPLSYRHQPEIARAAVEASRARADRLALSARVRADVEGACATVAATQRRAAAAREPARGATDDLGRVEAAYREGRIGLQEYLTFRARLIEAGLRYLDALQALEDARADLAASVGLDMATLDQRLSRP